MNDDDQITIQEVAHPHDRFFRQFIQQKETHQSFLKRYLPPAVCERINFDKLELIQTTFVDKHLKKRESDCIFSTQFNEQDGYVYFLIENQKKPDKLMPFRLWKYLLLLIQHHLDSHKTTDLPTVYPIVFYAGNKKYPYSMDFTELFNTDPAFIREILYKPFQLIDLSQFSPEDPIKDTMLQCLFIIMKHVREIERASPHLKVLLKLLWETGQEDIITAIINYVISVDKRPNEEVLTILTDIFSDTGVDMPNVAQQLKTEGKEIGLAEGLAKGEELGLAKGEELGLAKTAINMLKEGLDIALIEKVTGLSNSHICRLQDELKKSSH